MGAKEALEKYYKNQLKQSDRQKRTNGKPEFEVKKAVLKWLKDSGFAVNSIESKAVYTASAGRYLNGQTASGVSDLFGCTPKGLGCFIELKAPGRRSTLKLHQREFLIERIMIGGFAVCVDSVECLEDIWTNFELRMKMNPQLARNLLLRHLPEPPKAEEIDPEFGF